MKAWKSWLYALGVAVIHAAATAGWAELEDNKDFNFSHAGLVHLGRLIGVPALVAAFFYLKQSPLPNSTSDLVSKG